MEKLSTSIPCKKVDWQRFRTGDPEYADLQLKADGQPRQPDEWAITNDPPTHWRWLWIHNFPSLSVMQFFLFDDDDNNPY